MKAIKRVFMAVCVAAVGGCAAEQPPQSTDLELPQVASTEQAVTLRECQVSLATCVRGARGLIALAECTADFGECNVQAIADLSEERETLADCTAAANTCLNNADNTTEVAACRAAYRECANDVVTTGIDSAIDAAEDAIADAFDAAVDAIGTVAEAADALNECREDARDCLTAADSVANATECREDFVECSADAVAIAEGLIEPLPGPTPSEVIEGFEDCRAETATCLQTAINDREIAFCGEALEACVGDATDLVTGTIEDIDDLADDLLPPGVPTPGDILNCNLELTACLLEFTPAPLCAADALECLATVDAN
jgi:hypothetical protein